MNRVPVWLTLAAIGGVGVCASPGRARQASLLTPAPSGPTRFEQDRRLDARVTLIPPGGTHARILPRIGSWTQLRIEREQAAAEFDNESIAYGAKGVPARAVMDALAARVLARWQRTEKGYRLLVSRRELDDAHLPSNEWRRERFAAGLDFIQGLDRLPRSQQIQLLSGRPLPLSALPTRMQQSVGQMLGALRREYKAKGMGETLQPDQLPEARFRLERERAKDFNDFFITVKVPGVGSSGWRFNDYEQQMQARDAGRAGRNGPHRPGDVYAPEKFEIGPKEAKRLTPLQRKVTLNMQEVTLPEALRRLHDKYGVAFVSDSNEAIPQRADVKIAAMPLGEALDRLTHIYADTEWEWRRHGFLVVRGPSNPARDPKQGQAVSNRTTQGPPSAPRN